MQLTVPQSPFVNALEVLSSDRAIRCVIISRRALVVGGIFSYFRDSRKIEVSACTDLAEYLATVKANGHFDLVIIDWSSARSAGVTIEEIKFDQPNQRIGVLFDNLDAALVNRVIVEGASGILLSTYSIQHFAQSIEMMASGDASLPAAYWRAMRDETENKKVRLSDREWAVLQDLSDGLSNSEIAENQGIALSTAKARVQTICRKLGVRSRLGAYSRARELGLI